MSKNKERHINKKNYRKEMAKVCKHFDDLCPGCRLRLLTLVTAHYINSTNKEQRVGYMMNYMMGLNAALEFVSITPVDETIEPEKQTLQ